MSICRGEFLIFFASYISILHSYKPYLELGVNKLSRGAEAHSETSEGMPDPREKYFKYMIVRHPLDRLGSAYTHMLDRYQYIKAARSSQQPKTVELKVDNAIYSII